MHLIISHLQVDYDILHQLIKGPLQYKLKFRYRHQSLNKEENGVDQTLKIGFFL